MRFSDNLPNAFDQDGSDGLDDAEVDQDFPLRNGTAETEATVVCPYCAEAVVIGLDPGSGTVQEYVEDCQVCCNPWRVAVAYHQDGTADVSIGALDT